MTRVKAVVRRDTIGHFGGMKAFVTMCVLGLGVSACAPVGPRDVTPDTTEPGEGAVRPVPRPASLAPPPPTNAVTVEDFDTTTTAEREAAEAAPPVAAERALGETIATLGGPAKPGFWLETPLVSAPTKGRVVAKATGESVLVDLIPIEGPDTAGSRISLAALRLLGVGLTGLHELQVYAL